MANLLSKAGGNKPICGLPPYYVKEYQGFKIGFIGFAGEDWLGCLTQDVDLNDLSLLDCNTTL